MGAMLDLDDVAATSELAKRQLEDLRKELATPIMVQTNRLVDALADARAELDRHKADADRLASALYGIVGIEPGEDTEAFCAAIELASPSEHEKTIAMNAIAALAAHEEWKNGR